MGNASYENRGCEAIVRGTMEILRAEFGPGVLAHAGAYGEPRVLDAQRAAESDASVRTFRLLIGARRWSWRWVTLQANKRLRTRFAALHAPLKPKMLRVSAALEIGGDNYSLDYEAPHRLIAMDRYLLAKGIPVVIWGASIGPFEANPVFAAEVLAHLRSLPAILVRESSTLEYLRERGISENVRVVADPAYVMAPVPVSTARLGFSISPGAIGINLSPFVAKYLLKSQAPLWQLTTADLEPWIEFATELVIATARKFSRQIVLVPHAESDLAGLDDRALLEEIARRATARLGAPVPCVPAGLSAAELKAIIAQCHVFAGARTHSTIAAISSGVPTLSVAYSTKARGLNRDVFGTLDHVVESAQLDAEEFLARLGRLIAGNVRIRDRLRREVPRQQAKAMRAGPILRAVLQNEPALAATG